MEDLTANLVGQFGGLLVNILIQFSVWRYLFVYYSLNGNKSRYMEKKEAYSFLFVIVSLVTYPILWVLGVLFWPLILFLVMTLIYFSFTFYSKWSDNNILPDPFGLANRSIQTPDSFITHNLANEISRQSDIAEDAFFTLLDLEGVTKAREILQNTIVQTNGTIPYSESRMLKLAYSHVKLGNIELAIEMFRLNVEVFPNSSNSFASLADALQIKGNKEESIVNYKKALELLVTDRSHSEQFFKNLLDDIKRDLEKLNSE